MHCIVGELKWHQCQYSTVRYVGKEGTVPKRKKGTVPWLQAGRPLRSLLKRSDADANPVHRHMLIILSMAFVHSTSEASLVTSLLAAFTQLS